MLIKGITVLLALVGVLGTVLPLLPGTPLIVIGAVIYGYSTHFTTFSITDLVILGLLSLFAEGVDYLFSLIGAKKFGASKLGLIGGMVGLFIALFTIGPMGIIVGPIVGAILAELLVGRPMDQAVRVGIGSLLGVLGGMVMTFVVSLVMAGWVILTVF